MRRVKDGKVYDTATATEVCDGYEYICSTRSDYEPELFWESPHRLDGEGYCRSCDSEDCYQPGWSESDPNESCSCLSFHADNSICDHTCCVVEILYRTPGGEWFVVSGPTGRGGRRANDLSVLSDVEAAEWCDSHDVDPQIMEEIGLLEPV